MTTKPIYALFKHFSKIFNVTIEGKVTGEYEVVCGFLCSSIITGGILIWTLPNMVLFFLSPFLIVFGILLLFDDIFPYGRQPYMASEAGGFITGVAISIIAFFSGFIFFLVSLAVLISVAKLARRFLIRNKRMFP